LHFHRPQQGVIRIDGVPLNEIDQASWRAAIGVVGQDPHIFDDTVRANILYGKPDATSQEVEAAARSACADEFINAFPRGYDTIVGNHGVQMSGGQRQRLALARALVRNPDILIIDEAAGALDAATERALQNALNRLAKDRTVILVAHRLSMVERTDFAIVLEEGIAVQEGPPHTLLGLEGAYAKMFRIAPRAETVAAEDAR
jgi:ABC-type multidrug transport system fused ATPase/permease subunit